LNDGREDFLAKCAGCHGRDDSGTAPTGQSLYPRVSDLRSPHTQNLTDDEIHYIIENGIAFTGMPAWGNLHQRRDGNSWKLVLYIRSLRPLSGQEQARRAQTSASAHYVGSHACAKCHVQIYEHWEKTPMANVVRDPRQHPDAIIPDLATNNVAKILERSGRVRVREPMETALFQKVR
jgi:Cytochrome C oxidase, cbb3-type, subunit III